MSSPVLNHQLCKNQYKERFKEDLKMCIYQGAALCDLQELESAVKEVVKETLSFLNSEADSSKAK